MISWNFRLSGGEFSCDVGVCQAGSGQSSFRQERESESGDRQATWVLGPSYPSLTTITILNTLDTPHFWVTNMYLSKIFVFFSIHTNCFMVVASKPILSQRISECSKMFLTLTLLLWFVIESSLDYACILLSIQTCSSWSWGLSHRLLQVPKYMYKFLYVHVQRTAKIRVQSCDFKS